MQNSSTLFSGLGKSLLIGATVGAALLASVLSAKASSHREAPMVAGDPKVDATDLYAFRSPDDPSTVTFVANYYPFQEPAGGPNFYAFDPSARYDIKIDNDGDAQADIIYRFRFETTTENDGTFLYNTGAITSLDDADWNVRQTYTLTRIKNGQKKVLGRDLPVPPVNIGPASTPDYADLQAAAISEVKKNTVAFAGQSDDPFFVDLGGIFDLLTIREVPGNDGGGVDGLKGYNVNSIALQVPIKQLTNDSLGASATAEPVIGVWTTSSRQKTSVLRSNGTQKHNGKFVQVSRLGAPLVNEVVIPLGDKNVWNGSVPADDGQFANYVTNPELGVLLNALYGIEVPPQGDFGTEDQRDDLIAIFLTGVAGLNQPTNVTASEQLRLNMSTEVSDDEARLGVLAGDYQGYPNGRRLADDVTDISLQAVAGEIYPLFHSEFTADTTGTELGDGVNKNDKNFRSAFPYLALPHQGFESEPHAD
jgi:hypothetical protein